MPAYISLEAPPNFQDLPPAELQILLSKAYIHKPMSELKQRPASERISIAVSLIKNLSGSADPILQKAQTVKNDAESELRATSPFGHAPRVPQGSPGGATATRINAFPKNIMVGGKKSSKTLKKNRKLKKTRRV